MKKLILLFAISLLTIGVSGQKISDIVSDGDTVQVLSDTLYVEASQIGDDNATVAFRPKPLFDAKVNVADTSEVTGGYVTPTMFESVTSQHIATYYVAKWGSDDSAGTFTSPWATWHYACNQLAAGDTLYIRGGIYYPTGVVSSSQYAGVNLDGIDGTADSLIYVFNYPGEKPILDCSLMTQVAQLHGIVFDNSDYWYLRGLTIRNVEQAVGEIASSGIYVYRSNYNTFERIDCYNIAGIGFVQRAYDGTSVTGNKYINCDGYDNYDYNSATAGGDGDGFDFGRTYNITDSTILIGCRAWNNSDDGFDGYQTEGIIVYQDCWAFSNGYDLGNGNGFKLGKSDSAVSSVYIRQLFNCISTVNLFDGITENQSSGLLIVYNALVYANIHAGINYAGDDVASIYRNISSFDNVWADYAGDHAVKTHDHNSYNFDREPNGPVADSSDYFSLDTMELYRPRKSDGSLPDIDFGKLRPGSDLAEAGIDVGLNYHGLSPDIGAIESGITGDPYNFVADGEADDDYEVDLPRISVLRVGLVVVFTANTANTDGATLEITSVGDLDAILKMNDQALATGDIEAGQVITVVFDGSNWQMTSQIAQ